ncbi:DNA damage-induced apoptosis suppressor protein [Carcharodon carcharias]|uniref:DNA damage-induced apoptosis suppressor protein n=1 Tax=Carcharodon carcharias TaxID=13397 RepID=UPI001B7F0657|nr:DNA damage-induced apoptosis suppressor protein [Carcharodon carcharias]
MYKNHRNQMNGKRSFVIASILCLHDTCFLYPACHKCGSRLLLNFGRFHCPKPACVSTAQNTNYRYRLSVKVAGKNDIFNITVFGSCLEPYFGTTAGCLHRYCEDLKKLQEPEGDKVQGLLVQAVEHCFIGRSFIFGVKASEFLPDMLSSSPSPLQTTINKSRHKKHLVACQIAVPNTAVYGCTVINYYKKLLDSGSIQDMSSISLLSGSPFITVDQSSTMIKSLTSLLSGNTQSFTQLNYANRLSNPWLQDFTLALTSVDCITIEEFSTAETTRVGSKWSISPPYHVEEANQNRNCDKSTSSAFPTSASHNDSDINNCSTNAMVNLPSSLGVLRLPNNDSTRQYYRISFDELQEGCLKSSFCMQRCYMHKPGDLLTNGKGSDEFQSVDKSYSLLDDSMDYNDSKLWDDLLFSESLGEFIAKVEANQQRCDEKVALFTCVAAVDGSIHSCNLEKLETDNLLNGTREQNSRIREVCTDSTNCNLTGTKENDCAASNNPKGLLNKIVDDFKSDNVIGKEVPLATALPLSSVDGSISSDMHIPNQEAILQICDTFVNPVSADNCSNKHAQTCEPKLHNFEEEQMSEYSSYLSEHKATEVNTLTDPLYTTNETYVLNNIDFQTAFPSAKQLVKMKKKIDNEFQDQTCINGCNVNKCDIKPASRSQLSSALNLYKNISFQNMCISPTEQEYDVSGDLFNDTGGDKEESSICLKTNLCILSKPKSTSKAFNKTNCKLSEQQCNISPCCLNGAADAEKKQNNNNSPENDTLSLSEHDFSDSQDFVPFSQSTPVSRFQSLKIFRGRETKALKMSPYVRLSPSPAAFKQRQNGQLKQQLLQIQNVLQQQSGSNQTSVSLNSSSLSNSPISKSYERDSDEWIPPSTTKTRIMSSHLSCAFNINKSRGVKLFTHVSYANAAMETADSKATTEGNKENDSSNQCRGNLYMKRPPAGKHTKPSLQQKVFNSTKVLLNKTEKLRPLVSSEIQIRKGLKVNDCTPAAFHSFHVKSEAPSCYSPELF